MAPEDVKGTKRKGAADAAPKPKKQKKVDEAAAATKKSAKALRAAVKPIDDVNVNVKVSRKRAADLFDDEAPAQDKIAKAKKPSKKSKVDGDAEKVTEVTKKVKRTQKKPFADGSDAQQEKKKDSHVQRIKAFKEQPEVEAAEEDEEDDQTAALLAGFESDNDEEDPEEDVELDTEAKADISAKTQKQLEKAAQKTDEPGVIYVGRIPHGFYESQMKAYFKQFGTVTRLRVSRNKRTGAAKHYAFVEFASAEVADIVARTMNNYLMFGHILQCSVIPTAQVNPNMFVGAGTRFKKDPRNKKEGAAMEHGAERAVWEKRIGREQKKRAVQNKVLQDEMDYEYTAPALKAVADVPKTIIAVEDGADQQLLAEASAADITDAVQAAESKPGQLTVTETTVKVKTKKPKKPAKSKNANDEADAAPEVVGVKPVVEPTADVEIASTAAVEPITESKPKKSKKSKAKTNVTTEPEGVVENVEAVAKAGAQAVVDAASAVVDKVEAVIDAGADAIVPETKPKKAKKGSKAKSTPTLAADAVLEVADTLAGTEPVVEKDEGVKEKKGKKANKSKSKAAEEEATVEAVEAETAAGAEPVKGKKAKKSKKNKADPVPETAEEAPVQSIVGDVVDKAKTSTKKVKAAKKNKPELVIEPEEAPAQSIVGNVVDKAKKSTKKVKKAKVSAT